MADYEYRDGSRATNLTLSRYDAHKLTEKLLALGYVGTGQWDSRMVYTPGDDPPTKEDNRQIRWSKHMSESKDKPPKTSTEYQMTSGSSRWEDLTEGMKPSFSDGDPACKED